MLYLTALTLVISFVAFLISVAMLFRVLADR